MSTEQAGALAAMEKSVRVLYRRNEAVTGKKLDEARAAVAELIEAGQYVTDYVLNYSALTYSPTACKEAADRLRDAIARAGGAK